jgi:hypothetical protein
MARQHSRNKLAGALPLTIFGVGAPLDYGGNTQARLESKPLCFWTTVMDDTHKVAERHSTVHHGALINIHV